MSEGVKLYMEGSEFTCHPSDVARLKAKGWSDKKPVVKKTVAEAAKKEVK